MMSAVALLVAALLEVGGDYLVRQGLGVERSWVRVGAGGLLLALYGIAVNLYWPGDFSKLLGLYVVVFFLVSQAWGLVIESERIDPARIVGGFLIVLGGIVIQWWSTG